ncbi:MAG: DUF1640 domain-containing protein [Candidatus Acididesulfobacter diazotrophicus]|jgi:DNA repair exonuclease SbcCD ATPase subunit|uniref:DUF1640 domain-containing protein n=1 Tax=Candidatus Acididesulfobacter diazotrophicus TaxID=2597226 RepID=A0A519BPU2_9DELT|nr:MAG: DUF1640 domain-containing protein [Candidatus Acididesulfobacter diazotrophicus]
MSTNALLEHRTDRLEEALIRLADAQAETQREMSEFKNEMSEFKNEMSEFKNEMRYDLEKYREENRLALEEYKEENRKENREMNKRWGKLSNKMGTIVEDIIYPAARPLISRYFNVEINSIDISSNVSRMNDNRDREEFDIIASIPDKVFLIEVKSTMRDYYINEFKDKIIRFFNFFPEYRNKQLVPIMASLSMQPNTVHMLTENHIYAMAYREWDYMDILNF